MLLSFSIVVPHFRFVKDVILFYLKKKLAVNNNTVVKPSVACFEVESCQNKKKRLSNFDFNFV